MLTSSSTVFWLVRAATWLAASPAARTAPGIAVSGHLAAKVCQFIFHIAVHDLRW
jgi:hypothetical protein